MKRRADIIEYNVKVDSVERKCAACRKTIKNEPYAIKKQYLGGRKLSIQMRCWRCWHGDDITQLFLNKYPGLFEREKVGQWWYLYLTDHWFHFPSDNGEQYPDY